MATIEQLIEQAKEAGASAGSASERIKSCIDNAAYSGFRDYESADIKSMRTAYVGACKAVAGLDAKSQSNAKAAGLNMFARAWDALVDSCGLTPRPGKGTGRNAGKASKAKAKVEAAEAPAPAPVEITINDVPANVRRQIEHAYLVAMLTKHGVNDLFVLAAEHASCFKDASKSIIEADKTTDDSERKTHLKHAREYVKDAGHAFGKIGRGLEKLNKLLPTVDVEATKQAA